VNVELKNSNISMTWWVTVLWGGATEGGRNGEGDEVGLCWSALYIYMKLP
jgi:hypothetical protein